MKTLSVVVVFFCALCAYCVPQYDFGTISASKNDIGAGSKYTAVAARGGIEGGLQNTLYFNQSAYLYTSFLKGEGVEFGGYYLDGKDKGSDIRFAATGDGQYTAVDAKGNPIEFKAGDAVGFWVKNAKGDIIYNTPGLPEQNQTLNGTWLADNKYTIGFGEKGEFINSKNYDQIMNDAGYVFDVQVGSTRPNPSGQPLPGVLAALLLGGGSIGFLKRKRNAGKTIC